MSNRILEFDPASEALLSLAQTIVTETGTPEPDIQVYQQTPLNNLYYRESGRLLTPESSGNYAARVGQGIDDEAFIELQRSGKVDRQVPDVAIPGRINPVFAVSEPSEVRNLNLRWVNEGSLWVARPNVTEEGRVTISVSRWLARTVFGEEFQRGSAASDKKVTSRLNTDEALALCKNAAQAYIKVKTRT